MTCFFRNILFYLLCVGVTLFVGCADESSADDSLVDDSSVEESTEEEISDIVSFVMFADEVQTEDAEEDAEEIVSVAGVTRGYWTETGYDDNYNQKLSYRWDDGQPMIVAFNQMSNKVATADLGKLVSWLNADLSEGDFHTSVTLSTTDLVSADLTPDSYMSSTQANYVGTSSRGFYLSPVTSSNVVTSTEEELTIELTMPASGLNTPINSVDHLTDYMYIYSNSLLGTKKYQPNVGNGTFYITDAVIFNHMPATIRCHMHNYLSTDKTITLKSILMKHSQPAASSVYSYGFYPTKMKMQVTPDNTTWQRVFDDEATNSLTQFEMNLVKSLTDSSSPTLTYKESATAYALFMPNSVSNALAGDQMNVFFTFEIDGTEYTYQLGPTVFNTINAGLSVSAQKRFVAGYYYDFHCLINDALLGNCTVN